MRRGDLPAPWFDSAKPVPAGEAESGAESQPESQPESLWADSMFGVRWIYQHKPLFKFLLVAVFANFFLSIGIVLMSPFRFFSSAA